LRDDSAGTVGEVLRTGIGFLKSQYTNCVIPVLVTVARQAIRKAKCREGESIPRWYFHQIIDNAWVKAGNPLSGCATQRAHWSGFPLSAIAGNRLSAKVASTGMPTVVYPRQTVKQL